MFLPSQKYHCQKKSGAKNVIYMPDQLSVRIMSKINN